MKKIISFFLVIAMLLSTVSIDVFAGGNLVFSDDFSTGFIPKNWITKGNKFKWEKETECIVGYADAVVVESNYGTKYNKWWDVFYAGMDFQIRAFDDLPTEVGRTHSVAIWYNDLFERAQTMNDDSLRGANYMFYVEIETGNASLHKWYEFSYYDEFGVKREGIVDTDIAVGNVGGPIEVGESAPWYNFGIRVTEGKIECYFNKELVLSSSAEDGCEKIGHVFADSVDETVGSEKSAVVFFNNGNYMAFDNFEVWEPILIGPDWIVIYGDADSDGAVKLGDVSLILKHVAGWSDLTIDLTSADVNLDESVNLTDASTILKYIAGWDGIVLGSPA